jgi:hypothetical protein
MTDINGPQEAVDLIKGLVKEMGGTLDIIKTIDGLLVTILTLP